MGAMSDLADIGAGDAIRCRERSNPLRVCYINWPNTAIYFFFFFLFLFAQAASWSFI